MLNIYAVITVTGRVTGPNQFQGVNGTLSVYIDPNQDTTWSITSFINAATLSGNADDLLIGTSNIGSGTASRVLRCLGRS